MGSTKLKILNTKTKDVLLLDEFIMTFDFLPENMIEETYFDYLKLLGMNLRFLDTENCRLKNKNKKFTNLFLYSKYAN